MLRVCVANTTARRAVLQTRASRYYSTEIKQPNKICALPFKLQEDKLEQVINIASYMNQHAFFGLFRMMMSMFTKKLPQVGNTVSSFQVRKAYVPIWYYDMAISADIKPELTETKPSKAIQALLGPPRQALAIGFDCFWPGHTWDPMCYLAFLKPAKKPLTLVPFTKDLIEKDDIEVIPFSVDPLKDIGDRASSALEGHKVNVANMAEFTINNAQVLFQAAYPIYWPVYIAQFTVNERDTETAKTIVVSGETDDPAIYQWQPEKSGVYQWINNGSWINLDVTERLWHQGPNNPLEQLVKGYIDKVVGKFQVTENVDWDDDRVQNITEYQERNKEYLQQLFKVWSRKSMLASIENMDEDKKLLGIGKGAKLMSVKEIRQDIMNRVEKELVELERLEPIWYKDHIKNNKKL